MPGNFLVCPDTANLAYDSSHTASCSDGLGNTAWEVHHTDELTLVSDEAIAHLADTLLLLVEFDETLFFVVLSALVLTWFGSWTVGLIARVIQKTG